MKLIIFGAPGVGKGTQAKIISQKLNIPHISTGDILREAIKNETELGKKAKEIVHTGGLVPDELVGGMIREKLSEKEMNKGFILDGFPRTIPQAEILEDIFSELGFGKPVIIKLSADDSVIVKRLSSRRTCSNCGAIVNLLTLENPDVCPECGSVGTLVQRKDDNEETIMNRLKVYHESTAPVFNFYKDKAVIIEVDGTLSVEEVNKNILEELEKLDF